MEQKKKEDELRHAEQDRIRADGEQSRLSFLAEEERRIRLAQIQKLEEELRKAKENADYGEEEEHGGEHGQKRGRSLSQDSRQESTVSGTLGATCLTYQQDIEQSEARSSIPSRFATSTEAPPYLFSQLAHSRMIEMLELSSLIRFLTLLLLGTLAALSILPTLSATPALPGGSTLC